MVDFERCETSSYSEITTLLERNPSLRTLEAKQGRQQEGLKASEIHSILFLTRNLTSLTLRNGTGSGTIWLKDLFLLLPVIAHVDIDELLYDAKNERVQLRAVVALLMEELSVHC